MNPDLALKIAYEHMLISRHAVQGVLAFKRDAQLDRSATILLARLHTQGPMTTAELSDAFGLDISTIHRQIAAAAKNGLIEKIRDPQGGQARLHRATDLGVRALEIEFEERQKSVARVVQDWQNDDAIEFARLLRKFNTSVEIMREQPWPRTYPPHRPDTYEHSSYQYPAKTTGHQSQDHAPQTP